MRLTVASWNIGGVKYLRNVDPKLKQQLNDHIKKLCQNGRDPVDILLLQEIVTEDVSGTDNLIESPVGYEYWHKIVIDTVRHSHPQKWQQIRSNRNLPPTSYLAQGSAILWSKRVSRCPLWSSDGRPDPGSLDAGECVVVQLDTGLYAGSRDTEPRVAIVARFEVDGQTVIVVNVHLTTLLGEREGNLEREARGAEIRRAQIRLVLDGIVSRYNEWWEKNHVQKPKPIWIIGGDLNAIPESEEILALKRARFVDLCPTKGQGTKRRKDRKLADLTLDYLFAGILHHSCFLSEEPSYGGRTREPPIVSAEPMYFTGESSDHFPIVATLTTESPVGTV